MGAGDWVGVLVGNGDWVGKSVFIVAGVPVGMTDSCRENKINKSIKIEGKKNILLRKNVIICDSKFNL